MEKRARERFFTKLSYQGFLIEESGASLILTPKGGVEPAQVTISEELTGEWRVTGASGAYTRYAKGHHRRWFEALITRMVSQAIEEVK